MNTYLDIELKRELRADTLDELKVIEEKIEERARDTGAHRFMKQVEDNKRRETETSSAAGSKLLDHYVPLIEQGIKDFIDHCESGRAGGRHKGYKYIKALDPRLVAYLGLHSILERMSKRQERNQLCVRIGRCIEDELRLQEYQKIASKAEWAGVERAFKEKNSYSSKRRTAYWLVTERGDFAWQKAPVAEMATLGGLILTTVMNTVNLFEEVKLPSTKKKKQGWVSYIVLTTEGREWVEGRHEALSMLRPYHLPMVIPPMAWSDPMDGGYMTEKVAPYSLVKTHSDTYLEDLASVDMPEVYEAVNNIQSVPWQINLKILEVIETLAQGNSEMGKIPRRDPLDVPSCPPEAEQDPELLKAWKRRVTEIHKQNVELSSKRIGFHQVISVAKDFAEYKNIYFPAQLDFRGRVYARTANNLHPQGPDYVKALLEFSNGQPLGEDGAYWLAIHGANLGDFDKISKKDLQSRVDWVKDNEALIVAIAEDPYTNNVWTDADKPLQFLGFCLEWAEYLKVGDSFVSRIPVALDGSCSGVQHYSSMLRDEVGGKQVNLIPDSQPADIYRAVSDKVNEQLENLVGSTDKIEGEEWTVGQYAQAWLDFGVSRSTVKRNVMTFPYSSRAFGFRQQTMDDILMPLYRDCKRKLENDMITPAEYKQLFPFPRDGWGAAHFLSNLTWEAVTSTVLKAGEMMDWMRDSARKIAKGNVPIRYETPLGFPVFLHYPKMNTRRVESTLKGKRLRLHVLEPTEDLDSNKCANTIAPNVIHSLDSSHLMMTVNACFREGIDSMALVHDSFGCPAAQAGKLFRIVREQMVRLYEETDVPAEMQRQFENQMKFDDELKLLPVPLKGKLDLQGINASDFAFA